MKTALCTQHPPACSQALQGQSVKGHGKGPGLPGLPGLQRPGLRGCERYHWYFHVKSLADQSPSDRRFPAVAELSVPNDTRTLLALHDVISPRAPSDNRQGGAVQS